MTTMLVANRAVPLLVSCSMAVWLALTQPVMAQSDHFYQGKTLRLVGGLGPLQDSGLQGSLTWDLADKEGGTEATLTYSVGGYRQGGLQPLAPIVDTVLSTQLRRLKNFAEKGTPAP